MNGLVSDVELNADGTKLIGCCWDNLLTPCYSQVWNFQTGKAIGPRLMHHDGVLWACFSPDGLRIGSASEDFTAIIWDALTWRQRIAPVRHHDQVMSIGFSPTGDAFVTGSSDKTARVWSTETGDPLTPPLRHILGVQDAMFLEGGRRVLTVTTDGAKYIWDLQTDDRPVEDLCALANVLSGSTVGPGEQGGADDAKSLQAIWRHLRDEYPPTFNISASEISRWHEFEAEESETNGNWFSAAFHLKYLLTNDPTKVAISARLATATENLRLRR
jgi:WD40 repeat protein